MIVFVAMISVWWLRCRLPARVQRNDAIYIFGFSAILCRFKNWMRQMAADDEDDYERAPIDDTLVLINVRRQQCLYGARTKRSNTYFHTSKKFVNSLSTWIYLKHDHFFFAFTSVTVRQLHWPNATKRETTTLRIAIYKSAAKRERVINFDDTVF